MTKKIYSPLVSFKPGRMAASLFMGGAIGLLSLSVQAQPAAAAAATAVQVSAPSQEAAAVVPKVQAFQTAPSLRSNPLATSGAAEVVQQSPALDGPRAAPSERPSGAGEEVDVHWVLNADNRPWPLAYSELIPLNTLLFTLPNERDARIMLPGQVADMAGRARFTASRYITDNIGSAAQVRGRQLETLTMWLTQLEKQKQLLPNSDWAKYQFYKEAHQAIGDFKAKVMAQTAPTLARMAEEVSQGVAQISAVMATTESYEHKMLWYNVLVQLKEGVGLYQSRVTEADAQIMEAIAKFERDNPRVMRPAGAPPPQVPERAQPTLAPSAVDMAPASAPQPAKAPPGVQPQGSQTGGFIVLVGMVAAAVALFLRLRKRVSNSTPKADSKD